MDIRRLYQPIESHEFAVQLNMAGTYQRLFSIASKSDHVIALKEALADPDSQHDMLLQIFRLVDKSIDLRYENPKDVAITIYVWALLSAYRPFGLVAAEYATRLRNAWWSTSFSNHTLQNSLLATETENWFEDIADALIHEKANSSESVIVINSLGSNLHNATYYVNFEPPSSGEDLPLPNYKSLAYHYELTVDYVTIYPSDFILYAAKVSS